MGSNYDCFRLRKDYRHISCEPCNKSSSAHKPPCNKCVTCEDRFAMDIARAIGGLLQCMACAPRNCCEGSVCVKLLDECTRVPLSNIPVALVHNGMQIAEVFTCPKGTARFNGLCDGYYSVVYPCAATIETIEINKRCPYVMLVITVPQCCKTNN